MTGGVCQVSFSNVLPKVCYARGLMVIEKERFLPTTGGLDEFVMCFICLPNNEGWYYTVFTILRFNAYHVD